MLSVHCDRFSHLKTGDWAATVATQHAHGLVGVIFNIFRNGARVCGSLHSWH